MKHILLWVLLLTLLTSVLLQGQVTIIVNEVPNNTPEDASIFIAGNFQEWNPAAPNYELIKQPNGDYQIVLENVTGDILFKFTRGSWETVEGTEDGGFIPDRSYTVTDGETLTLQVAGWEDLGGGGNQGQSTAVENVNILSESFYMESLDRYRRIWIYLPPNYDESNEDYPVLYVHDGQNVFDAFTSFAGEWEVDETLNDLFANGDKGVIVVGIDNGQAFRIAEYTPWVNPQYGGGQGDEYVDFIAFDLKPYIDDNYRTLSDRNHTGILGSSLGGLISLYAGIKHQNVFSKIGAFSPAYWINPELYDYLTNTPITQNLRIYQMGGTPEGASLIDNMQAVETILETVDDQNKITLLTEEFSDGQHSEWFWAREFGDAYLWLFEEEETMSAFNEIEYAALAFKVGPNPTDGKININIDLKEATALSIQLYALNGQMFYTEETAILNQGLHTIPLDVSKHLDQNILLLKVITNGEVFYSKVSINH